MTATVSVLLASLLGLGATYWHRLWLVGDELNVRLEALSPADLAEVPPADRYARFEHRDYSSDRGGAPDEVSPGLIPVPLLPDVFGRLLRDMGLSARAVGQ